MLARKEGKSSGSGGGGGERRGRRVAAREEATPGRGGGAMVKEGIRRSRGGGRGGDIGGGDESSLAAVCRVGKNRLDKIGGVDCSDLGLGCWAAFMGLFCQMLSLFIGVPYICISSLGTRPSTPSTVPGSSTHK